MWLGPCCAIVTTSVISEPELCHDACQLMLDRVYGGQEGKKRDRQRNSFHTLILLPTLRQGTLHTLDCDVLEHTPMIINDCFKASSLILAAALASGLGLVTAASAQDRSYLCRPQQRNRD